MGLRIVGIGLAVPPTVETATDLSSRISENAAWIERHTGVLRRHVATPDLQVADLAAEAAAGALGGRPPDLILYASATQHQLLPDTSVYLQQAIGLSGVASFSIHATCMSFLASLQVANSLLASQAYRRILICSAEIATRARDFSQPESAALLGDGAGAAVVEWDNDSQVGMRECLMKTWPEGAAWAEVRGCGHRKRPGQPGTQPEDYLFQMRGRRSYKLTRMQLPRLIQQVLDRAELSLEDIDCIVPHQASGPGLRLLERLGFARERIVNILADYGNCVAASIPMALAVAVRSGRIAPGDRVLFLGAGAGLSVGAALLQW